MTGKTIARAAVLVALAAVVAALATGGAAASNAPCGGATDDRCGLLSVPLDRSNRVPGTLTLRYRVVRTHQASRKGTVILLAGGPGQAALPLRSFRGSVARLMPGYDVAVIDTRGTGAGALNCPALHDAGDDVVTPGNLGPFVSQCATELGSARSFYGSRAIAADIEAFRVELGAPRVVVLGVSYGTLQAQVYAQLYPGSVEALVLDSVADPQRSTPVGGASFVDTGRVLRELCSGRRCAGITRDLVGDVARLQKRMEQRPLKSTVVLPWGRRVTRTLGGPGDPTALFRLLAAGDFSLDLRGLFPAAVRSALDGDPAPLLRMAEYLRFGDSAEEESLSTSVFVATTCMDMTVPWAADATLTDRLAAVDRVVGAIPAPRPWTPAVVRASSAGDMCAAWPDPPAPVVGGSLPDVPALILVGRQDVRTPLAEAKTVAARLPRATVIAVPDEGHSLIGGSPCANRALRDFSRALRSPTSTCKPLRSLRFRASPSPRLRLRVGERRDASVLSALYQTFFSAEDGAYALSVPTESGWVMGGLRTGVVHIGADFETYRFRGYSDLPGFVVSGTITRRRFDLTVTGMWHGRVVYSKKTGVVVHEDPLDVRLRG